MTGKVNLCRPPPPTLSVTNFCWSEASLGYARAGLSKVALNGEVGEELVDLDRLVRRGAGLGLRDGGRGKEALEGLEELKESKRCLLLGDEDEV